MVAVSMGILQSKDEKEVLRNTERNVLLFQMNHFDEPQRAWPASKTHPGTRNPAINKSSSRSVSPDRTTPARLWYSPDILVMERSLLRAIHGGQVPGG